MKSIFCKTAVLFYSFQKNTKNTKNELRDNYYTTSTKSIIDGALLRILQQERKRAKSRELNS